MTQNVSPDLYKHIDESLREKTHEYAYQLRRMAEQIDKLSNDPKVSPHELVSKVHHTLAWGFANMSIASDITQLSTLAVKRPEEN